MASLNHPGNLKYSKTDEWVRVEGDLAYIGITDYAQDQLGDIVYIELPWEPGQDLAHEDKFGDIESVKATSELLSPLSGAVIKANEELKEHPELINDYPYDQGWMLQVKLANPSELDDLLDVEQYLNYIQGR
ncbi:glycine cleavage system protein GcvH [Tengunoibacter tsumagoiensis]|uniref:Glycine cleavage system H protein n=1 Tax=Tengunoibacter tsumagoiensis TaxID=2014871 RepID=A0A401ZVV4_9CHLR|nr:glycine cleavage system protein GcvH [Tengunoibacter tsumagoiensis]GCE11038.1 glycine cleavage system H protein [Tengunoibacter tsumagoiensis]